jgi:N-acetylglucosaminyl-diphospho-decaprenol L-rhamnosyltransferase
MVRPAAFSPIGGMDENHFFYFEETDFRRCAKRAGFSTSHVPESRVMQLGGQTTSIAPHIYERLPGYWFESRSGILYWPSELLTP